MCASNIPSRKSYICSIFWFMSEEHLERNLFVQVVYSLLSSQRKQILLTFSEQPLLAFWTLQWSFYSSVVRALVSMRKLLVGTCGKTAAAKKATTNEFVPRVTNCTPCQTKTFSKSSRIDCSSSFSFLKKFQIAFEKLTCQQIRVASVLETAANNFSKSAWTVL